MFFVASAFYANEGKHEYYHVQVMKQSHNPTFLLLCYMKKTERTLLGEAQFIKLKVHVVVRVP